MDHEMEGYWKDRGVAYLLSDLSQSVFATLGLPGTTNVLDIPQNDARRECILLIDGMGMNALGLVSKTLPIFSQLQMSQQLSATFPSTTSSSLTSLGTGIHVGAHGMVGYTMRVPHSGAPERLLNALKWDERVDPFIWQSESTLFERGRTWGLNVSHIAAKRYEETGFTRAALRGANYRGVNVIDDMVTETKEALSREGSFAYVYINDVDDASHREGLGSPKFHAAMSRASELITKLIENLPRGSRLWVTTDHGMINRDDYCVLGKENDLLKNVDLLGGEPRVRYLYLKPELVAETRSQWEESLGDKVHVYSREESIGAGLFGPSVSEKNVDRIGDLIVIAQGNFILVEPEREELQLAMVGHHGGVTKAETEIPLLMHQL
jgi:predicted AlkP superfamily pyrophosphatase or phosphodiesterase